MVWKHMHHSSDTTFRSLMHAAIYIYIYPHIFRISYVFSNFIRTSKGVNHRSEDISHWCNNKDPIRLWWHSPGMRVKYEVHKLHLGYYTLYLLHTPGGSYRRWLRTLPPSQCAASFQCQRSSPLFLDSGPSSVSDRNIVPDNKSGHCTTCVL